MSFTHVGDDRNPSMVIYEPPLKPISRKVFFFDLDWTLIHPTKSLASSIYDFYMLPDRFTSEGIPKLIGEGFDIAIITTLVGKTADFARAKIEYFFQLATRELDKEFYCTVICIMDPSIKKPNRYAFDYYKSINPNVDASVSFYCGDAAGRIYTDINTEMTYMIDYSDDDLQFATAVGLKFLTPEEVFPVRQIQFPYKQEIVVMMGMPGSGKSWISKNLFVRDHGYKIVQQDFLKSFERCLSTTRYYVEQGFSVVVDNTNPMDITRVEYVNIGRYYGIPVRLIYVAQEGQNINKQRRNPVPYAAYGMYFKRLVYPQETEGFNEIIIHWAKEKDSDESIILGEEIALDYVPAAPVRPVPVPIVPIVPIVPRKVNIVSPMGQAPAPAGPAAPIPRKVNIVSPIQVPAPTGPAAPAPKKIIITIRKPAQLPGQELAQSAKKAPKTIEIAYPYLGFIRSGIKKYEGRLYRGQWTDIHPGDELILYSKHLDGDPVKVLVSTVTRYNTFAEMYSALGKQLLPNAETVENAINIYNWFYTAEDQAKYGAVAIGLVLMH
jgi:DNA 3'-phosphatase